jgi:hypothetical protein
MYKIGDQFISLEDFRLQGYLIKQNSILEIVYEGAHYYTLEHIAHYGCVNIPVSPAYLNYLIYIRGSFKRNIKRINKGHPLTQIFK